VCTQYTMGKLATECRTVLVFTAVRDDVCDGGDKRNRKTRVEQ